MARSGQFNSVEEMRRQLTVEGYGNIEAHLSGFSIRKDLKALISKARSVI